MIIQEIIEYEKKLFSYSLTGDLENFKKQLNSIPQEKINNILNNNFLIITDPSISKSEQIFSILIEIYKDQNSLCQAINSYYMTIKINQYCFNDLSDPEKLKKQPYLQKFRKLTKEEIKKLLKIINQKITKCNKLLKLATEKIDQDTYDQLLPETKKYLEEINAIPSKILNPNNEPQTNNNIIELPDDSQQIIFLPPEITETKIIQLPSDLTNIPFSSLPTSFPKLQTSKN